VEVATKRSMIEAGDMEESKNAHLGLAFRCEEPRTGREGNYDEKTDEDGPAEERLAREFRTDQVKVVSYPFAMVRMYVRRSRCTGRARRLRLQLDIEVEVEAGELHRHQYGSSSSELIRAQKYYTISGSKVYSQTHTFIWISQAISNCCSICPSNCQPSHDFHKPTLSAQLQALRSKYEILRHIPELRPVGASCNKLEIDVLLCTYLLSDVRRRPLCVVYCSAIRSDGLLT